MARMYGPPNLMQNHIIPLLKYWQTSKREIQLPYWRKFLWTIAYDLDPAWVSVVTSSDTAVLAVSGPILTSPPHTWSIQPVAPGVASLTMGIQLADGTPSFPIGVILQVRVY
jgi:hypothetical protein